MAFEELRERISDQTSNILAQIKESSVYNNLKEKFDILPVTQQNAIMAVVGITFAGILIMIPYSSLNTSWENENLFTEYRDLMRELLRSSTIKDTQSKRVGFSASRAMSGLRGELRLHVLEEQIASIQPFNITKAPRVIPSQIDAEGLRIRVNQLNLRQIIKVGYAIQNESDNSQLFNIDIKVNPENDHFFDVTYELIGFNLKSSQAIQPEDDGKKSRKSRSRNKDK